MSKSCALKEMEIQLSNIAGNTSMSVGKEEVNGLLAALGSEIRFDEYAHWHTVNYTIMLETLKAFGREGGV